MKDQEKCVAMRNEKPPLGVVPQYLWIESRINDLIRTIYQHGGVSNSNPEWVSELIDLLNQRNNL